MKPLLAVLLVLPLSAGAQPAETYTNAAQGFRIRKPEPPFTLTDATPAPETTFTLKIARVEGATETSLTVYVVDKGAIADAAGACGAAEGRRKADAKVSGLERGEGPLAGERAPWLRFRYAANVPYVVRQSFLVHHGAIFVVQVAAPADAFEAAEKELKPLLESFAFVPVADAEERKDAELLRRLAARCGAEVRWAATWGEAAARAKEEDRLVLVVVEQYRGLAIERYAPSTLFMDTDFVGLVQERFVPFVWHDRCGAPFEAPEVYGLGPFTFGQGLLFADAEGRIVAEGTSLDPFAGWDAALAALKARPGRAAPEGAGADLLLRRGELAAAEKFIAADDWKRKADLLRRRRRGDEALRALAAGGTGLELEQAVLKIRMGLFGEAERLLQGKEEPEAVFWRLLARGMREGLEPLRAETVALAKAHPDDRWAWRAAAMQCGLGMASGIDRAAWHDEARLAGCLPPPYEPVHDAARAERDAIAFLLRTQLKDGSWPSPHALSEPQGGLGVAVAAIAGRGLLPYAAREDCAAAARRALDFVLANPPASRPGRLFDYAVWGQIFSLRFLASCAAAKFGDKEDIADAMNALVSSLRRDRFPDGGWAYFRQEGSPGAAIGFVTAAALCALLEAKSAGAEVPAEMTEGAAKVVASMKQARGAFGYFAAGGADPKGREAEAAFRSPLYALALKRAGKGDVEGIRESLALYREFREHDRKERGKSLCHTSPEGLASYYLLFGLAFAMEAVEELSEKERAALRAAIVEDVLTMRTAHGGFCDNPAVGRHYGAGMALDVLRRAVK